MTRSRLIVTFLTLVALFGVSPALAQQSTQANTITSTGYGEASAPAAAADIQIVISNQETLYGGPSLPPQVEATPGAEAQASVAPVADALSGAGVETVAIVIPPYRDPYGGPPAVARIDVTVTSPDLAMLTSLVTTAVQAAAGERLVVTYVGVRYTAGDCHALEQAAREAALEDARGKAGIQAGLLGADLGEVIATRDVIATPSFESIIYGAVPAAQSNCDAAVPPVSSTVTSVTFPRFDPTADSGEVEVYRTVEVTFGMTGSGATPAS